MIIDRKNILSELSQEKSVSLELGCGNNKRHKDAIAVDILNYDCVDLVGDIFDVLSKMPDNCIDNVWSSHFFEHIDNVEKLLKELSRVMKHNGILEIIVPHFSNPFYYSDPTHKNFFGLYTLSYYIQDDYFHRKVPNYSEKINFEITTMKLNFKSLSPRYIRHGIKKIFELVFNISPWFQELYEESFSSLISCYEIKFTVKNIKYTSRGDECGRMI